MPYILGWFLCFVFLKLFFHFPLTCPLIHWLFKNAFNFHKFVKFLASFLLLSSSFIQLWLRKRCGMSFPFLNLLKIILWPNIWPILENISHMLKKNMQSSAVGWWVLCLCVTSIWSVVLFKSTVSLTHCLDLLSIVESGVLKSPALVLLSISLLSLVNTVFVDLVSLTLRAYIFIIVVIFLTYWPSHYILTFFVSFDSKSILSDISVATSILFCLTLAWNIFLYPFSFSHVHL
jgi:hypothetical protein